MHQNESAILIWLRREIVRVILAHMLNLYQYGKAKYHPDTVENTWFCKTKCDIYSREEFDDDTGHYTSCQIMFGITTPISEAVAENRSLINAGLVDGWIETGNALLRAFMLVPAVETIAVYSIWTNSLLNI